MTEQQAAPTSSTDRSTQVESAIDRLATSVREEHPQHADVVHPALERLRDRLRHAHEHPHQVHESAWAAYMTDLEGGLDELQIELASGGEHTDGAATPDDMLYRRTTALELSGWRLRVDAARQRPASLDLDPALPAKEHVDAASEALADYERARLTALDASRAGLEVALAAVRGTLD